MPDSLRNGYQGREARVVRCIASTSGWFTFVVLLYTISQRFLLLSIRMRKILDRLRNKLILTLFERRPIPSDSDWFLSKYLTRNAKYKPYAAQTSLNKLQQMGFTLVLETPDGLFYRMIPPLGYTKTIETVSSDIRWIYILDPDGKKVASQFQKEADYDWDTFITFSSSEDEGI
jgi:hypothetical protein